MVIYNSNLSLLFQILLFSKYLELYFLDHQQNSVKGTVKPKVSSTSCIVRIYQGGRIVYDSSVQELLLLITARDYFKCTAFIAEALVQSDLCYLRYLGEVDCWANNRG